MPVTPRLKIGIGIGTSLLVIIVVAVVVHQFHGGDQGSDHGGNLQGLHITYNKPDSFFPLHF